MDHFTLSLAVGAVAGALDVIPMIFQNLSARSCFSAFFIYFFAAVIVFYSDLPYLPWWADGMAVTLMLMIPVLFTFSGKDRKAIPVVVFNGLLFGFSSFSAATICASCTEENRQSRRAARIHAAILRWLF